MRSNKYLLGITALMAAGTFAVACSSGGGGSKTYALDSGAYSLHTNSVNNDTCFPPSVDTLLTSVPLTFNLTASAGTFTLTATGAAAALLPPLDGTKTGNDLTLSASGSVFLTSTCSLGFTSSATGTMTATDEFDTTIPLNVNAITTGGQTVDCSAEEGTTFGGVVPFPTLSGASNGTCALTIVGHVAPTTP